MVIFIMQRSTHSSHHLLLICMYGVLQLDFSFMSCTGRCVDEENLDGSIFQMHIYNVRFCQQSRVLPVEKKLCSPIFHFQWV